MKRRNPLLHQQLIGRFQSEEERMEEERPDMTNCSLSNIIMEHIDITAERELKQRLQDQEEEEEFDTDSEEEEEEDPVVQTVANPADGGHLGTAKRRYS